MLCEQKYPDNYIVPDGITTLWDNKKGFIIMRERTTAAGLANCETTVNGKSYQSNTYVLVIVGKDILYIYIEMTES